MSRENISHTALCDVVPSATESAHVVPSSIPEAGDTSNVYEVVEVGKRELFCMISKVTLEDAAKS